MQHTYSNNPNIFRPQKHRSRGSIVGWVALFVAVVALGLGWWSFNRTGANLEDQVATAISSALEEARQQTEAQNSAAQEAELSSARARAHNDLVSLQTELASTDKPTDEDAARAAVSIRKNLSDAYRDTSGDIRAQWILLDNILAQLETELAEGAKTVDETLQAAIEDLAS